jgi:hypothetical protein
MSIVSWHWPEQVITSGEGGSGSKDDLELVYLQRDRDRYHDTSRNTSLQSILFLHATEFRVMTR